VISLTNHIAPGGKKNKESFFNEQTYLRPPSRIREKISLKIIICSKTVDSYLLKDRSTFVFVDV
jgi:hypothetical protein